MLKELPGWILGPVAMAIAVGIIVGVPYLANTPTARMRAHLAAISEAGHPTKAADLLASYPPVEPSRNGALPLLKAAERIDWSDAPELSLDVDKHHRLHPGTALPPALYGAIRRHLQDLAEPLALLQTVMDYEAFRFPVQIEQGCAALRSNTIHATKCVELILLQAMEAAHRKDADATFQAIRVALKIASCLDNEPSPNGTTHPARLRFQVLKRLPFLLSRVSLKPQDAEQLADTLERGWPKSLMIEALARQRVFFIIDARLIIEKTGDTFDGCPSENFLLNLQQYDTAIKVVRDTPMSSWTSQCGPAEILVAASLSDYVRCAARIRAFATILRIEAMRSRHGRLPQTLAEVAKAYPHGNVTDPSTDKVMAYVVTPENYTITVRTGTYDSSFSVYHPNR